MKRCTSCGHILAQRITTCPACGNALMAGLTAIDDYRIQKIIHEGRSSLVCRAIREGDETPVTIRLFTDQSGVDQSVARRLEKELETLSKLPEDLFVKHFAIRKSSTGHWYRVSEWVDADNWGSIFVSGILNDQQKMVTLFYNIASALARLHDHDHFMPYLILDDILLPRDQNLHLAVKINYKLSRFLNARATHHGPMLNKLIRCHPDIVNKRAIDFRTGIWSLGKIFVELLSADHNLTDFSSRVDELKGLDPDLAVLIKVMLSDDPDLRPQSMAKVVATLGGLLKRVPAKPVFQGLDKPKPGLVRQLTRFRRMVAALLVVIAGLAAAAGFIYFTRPLETAWDEPTPFLESHTRSVGFLMVEYWLRHEEEVIYRNKVEGTAFLVDKQGYMLTNRHVACPWLEDVALFRIHGQLKDKELKFGHRMFFWFEGAKAFNRFRGFDQSTDLADVYYLTGAFRSDQDSSLRVAGVPRGIRRPGERLHLPFHNDFAVLKINAIPRGTDPLPLETRQDPGEIKRLSPVIIMGFPLGSRTQDEHINASITRGHVRRTSQNLIQVDSSIYKGNSGGPAINDLGRVIGIASGVMTDQPLERLPLQTPLSDFGLILPISDPARFVAQLKAGQPKWNGLLDFTLEKKLNQVIQLAATQDYEKAAQLARTLLKTSPDPAILFTTALMDFCINDLGASRNRFTSLLSIEGENMVSRLMLYIIDRLQNQNLSASLTRALFSVDWSHSDEYMGYLAEVLASGHRMDPGFIEYENRYEKAWRIMIDGLILEMGNAVDPAIEAYKNVVMIAGANDHLYFMAFSRLNRLLAEQATREKSPGDRQAMKQALWDKAAESRDKAKKNYEKALTLIHALESVDSDQAEKNQAIESLMELTPDNRTIMGRAAFLHAQAGEWEKAISFIDQYTRPVSRETPLGLSLDLLKGQILKLAGNKAAARDHLTRLQARIRNPWYQTIVRHLLAGPGAAELIHQAGNSPARLVVLHTALGLDAEATKDKEKAALHYREALGTYMDAWNEYDLARYRLLALKGIN